MNELTRIIENDYDLPNECPKCNSKQAIVTMENPSLFIYNLETKGLVESPSNYHADYLEITIKCNKCNYIFKDIITIEEEIKYN
ncbi:MAG: hypothetical protein GF317_22785 [Candidatus Lokiarchaeota archaeon]|nr:hypothetical protein [Candidatus Lokiarchaeota archaeon]